VGQARSATFGMCWIARPAAGRVRLRGDRGGCARPLQTHSLFVSSRFSWRLANAGYSLQGPDFPAGLVGVLQGMILFFALGGELLLRYRVRWSSPRTAAAAATA